jgi:hypothetical protein
MVILLAIAEEKLLIIWFNAVSLWIPLKQAPTTPRWGPDVNSGQGDKMGIFDKAIDKIEQSFGGAREKAGLEPDDESQVASETDPSSVNSTQADDTVKDV